jgi:hypothetical protein
MKKSVKKLEKLPPIIEKSLLLEVEKTFRRIWEKEQKTEALFKKAVSLHEQVQTLIAQELRKPENEQNKDSMAALYVRLTDAEEAIDTVASLTGELRQLREYFYGFMSEPRETEGK